MRWILALLVFGLIGCKNHKNGHTEAITETTEQAEPKALPNAVVYKTKGDYYNFVPVTLSDDKSKIVAYPHPSDVDVSGGFQLPLRLKDGYLLDTRGIGKNVAFIKLSYEEYAALDEAPSLQELYSYIIDKDPLLELYSCGLRGNAGTSVDELNKLIEKGELKSVCEGMN